MEQSDYVRRGYASLHIKAETHQRLNLVKVQMQARDKKFITQDNFVNLLLDHYIATKSECEAEMALP